MTHQQCNRCNFVREGFVGICPRCGNPEFTLVDRLTVLVKAVRLLAAEWYEWVYEDGKHADDQWIPQELIEAAQCVIYTAGIDLNAIEAEIDKRAMADEQETLFQ